ncbi:SDR family NAD(P)-dependent oxidoreductase [Herbiconiux sp. CPCC 205763]|uniref:SDR family NAD(P)-dependent oxidoreductase n=1 Tax=Herbiconiux aconitum TaxID=2970913 RepID=A0ABT2GX96_9MICO|nr:SDR family NAD(P)-dependent oxidoreductase [Herbiconiux aconitum]MCS5720197.1 SDR family NAD(P)-dependent oxidoreductase [Herbiconiux aconitum]
MSDDVWFVTGSSRGVGRSIVEAALAAGNRVAATDWWTAGLDDLIADHGSRLQLIDLDVTDAEECSIAMGRCVDRFGSVDVVVNNAGYADSAPIEEMALKEFVAQVDVVFYGTVFVTKAAIPYFRSQGSGYFVQVASVGGGATQPGLGAYQSAKFAVDGFFGVLRRELQPFGIRVTVAEPGSMHSDHAGDSGSPPVDPGTMARVLVELADDPEPPPHLLLGSNAIGIVEDRRSMDYAAE